MGRVSFLSFFIENEFRVGTVCTVSTDEDKIHIGSDAKAAFSAEFTFKLVAKVGSGIIKELYLNLRAQLLMHPK